MTPRVALALILFVSNPARADEIGLGRGEVEAALTIESNLSARLAGTPWSLAPDVAVGVTDSLTLGVTHSRRALGRIDSGGGLCLAGAVHGCERVYDGGALEARWRLRRGTVAVAARLRLASIGVDPWKAWAAAGAVARATRGRLVIVADPELQIGLVNRDLGNRDRFRLPLLVGARLPGGVAVLLRSGVEGEIATFLETFAVPLGLEVRWTGARLSLAAYVAFARLLGPENEVKSRHGGAVASWRW